MRTRHCRIHFLSTSLALVAAGCGSGGGSAEPGPEPTPAPDHTTEGTLHALGVDTTETPRVDHDGEVLPASYSPLGKTFELEKLSELLVLGPSRVGSTDPLAMFDLEIDEEDPEAPASLFYALSSEQVPWALDETSTGRPPVSRRAAARADVDGDGREELAFVHFAENLLHLTLIDDGEAAFARTDSVLIDEWTELLDVSLGAADVDGDGDDELVLAYSVPFKAYVAVVDRNDEGVMVLDEPGALSYSTEFHDSMLLADLAAGNLDYDGPEEVALVLNEYRWTTSSPLEFLGCRWIVLDDALAGLAELDSGELEAEDETSELGAIRTALVAGVAVGDLDSDGIDEIALGGLWLPDEVCIGHYVTMALDDAAHGLAPLGSRVLANEVGDEPGGGGGCEASVVGVHVGIADLEGDYAGEIFVNETVFWDLETPAPAWSPRAEIPDWFTRGTDQGPTQSAMIAADLIGSGRQQIAVFAQGHEEVAVWGIVPEDPEQELAKLRSLPLAYGTISQCVNPVLVPVNADSDTTIVEFVEHRWLMTEPIVVAVLAAPPAAEGIGQNLDACITEYGESTSTSTGSENSVDVSVGFIIGGEFKQWGNGVEVKAKFQAHYSHTWTSNYTVTTSVAYETGSLEDTVVCLVTPYDHYTYRVVSDPDPEHVGDLVEVSVPREPVSLQVERSFYNDALGADELQIDEAVLGHQIGDRASYPTAAEKDELIFEWGGLQTGPAAVGQGSGATTLGIAVATEEGSTDYLGGSFELEVETLVAGVKLGGSIGFGGGHTWTRSVGEETTYSGTVGSIDAEHFAAEGYSFGLFVYTQYAPEANQAFDVINYWVE